MRTGVDSLREQLRRWVLLIGVAQVLFGCLVGFIPPTAVPWFRGIVMAHIEFTANGILLIGIGRVKTKAAIHACVAATHILGAWFLIPRLGLMAIPVAGTAGYLIDAALSLPIALRHLRRQDLPSVSTAGLS